jgi:flagellar basal body rod protein FlgG
LPLISLAEGAVVLRLFPLSVVILALILLRLSCVHGWFSSTLAAGETVQPARNEAAPLWTVEPQDLTPDGKKWIDRMAREALTAPTPDERSAAALAAADQSTSKIANTLRAINAAEDVVMENVRQADTTGYKATRWAPRGDKPGFAIDLMQGTLKSTNGQLDVAIQGEGFFAISLDNRAGGQVGYTRAGNLFVNNKNELVVGIGEGYVLLPKIRLPYGVTNVAIGQDGTIQVAVSESGARQTIGRFALTRFLNPLALAPRASGILLATSESGPGKVGSASEEGFGTIQQGFLECSNVEVIGERMRLKFLHNWRAALDEALAGNGPRNVATTN